MGDFNKSDENGNHSTGDFMKMGSQERVMLTVDDYFQKLGSKSSRNVVVREGYGIMECWGFAYSGFIFFKIVDSCSHLQIFQKVNKMVSLHLSGDN